MIFVAVDDILAIIRYVRRVKYTILKYYSRPYPDVPSQQPFGDGGELVMAPEQQQALERMQALRAGEASLRTAVAAFAAAEGMTILSEHVEVEIGKDADALDRQPIL